MAVKSEVKQEILHAILALGKPATIREIEKKVSVERHTLSKYLDLLRKEGLLDYDAVGRAKLWRIDSAPLETIFTMRTDGMGFAERVLANLIGKIPCGIVVVDDLYRIQFMNELLIDMYGQGKGKAFYEFVLGLKNPLALDTVRDVVSGKSEYAEIELPDRDASTLRIKASLLHNPDGTNAAILIVEDVSYEKGVERAIRESERKYRRLVDASPDGVLLMDIAGTIALANRSAALLAGAKAGADLSGKALYELIVPEDRQRVRAALQELLRTGERASVRCALARGGMREEIEARVAIFEEADGKAMSLTASLRELAPAGVQARPAPRRIARKAA